MSAAIEFKKISKSYGSCQACLDISFAVEAGSIHALVGENGAGKSTLMNILGGLEKADAGQVSVKGKLYQPDSAKDAFENKIGFIHQHFMLAENLTVMEHLLLNWPSQSLLRPFNSSLLIKKIDEFSKRFNWTIRYASKIQDLSVGEQQRIEIIKALLTDPEFLIFDEPTAVLAPQEIVDFLNFLKVLKSQGKTIILISHKLAEIQSVADRLTVLRHGQSILTEVTSKMSIEQIAESMMGQKIGRAAVLDSSKSAQNKLLTLDKINLDIRLHEILGVVGIEGHGQGALVTEILSEMKSHRITTADIPEDRLKYGIFEGLNLIEHMVLRHPELSSHGFIQKEKAHAATQKIVTHWDVRPYDIFLDVDQLSGGNQQKFVIGRELFHDPTFILAAHPTRGVDLGAQQMIHTAFLKQKIAGKSIVLISSDLDEVLKLADRYIILFKNQIFGPFSRRQLGETEIGQFMTGSHPAQKQFLLGGL